MIVPKLVLIKKKRTLLNMPTSKIEEILNNSREELKQIQMYKKLYKECYVDKKTIFILLNS